MASTQEIICKCGCGRKRAVRTADVARGWGKFYDKSCKAKWQERRTGQHARFLRSQQPQESHPLFIEDDHIFSSDALGQS